MKNLILFACAVALASCGDAGKGGFEHPEPIGDRVYGGTLRVTETDEPISLYPHSITDVVSHNIANQIYEGLVRFDPRNITRVLPSIAERWETDASGTVYTFHLRKGVKFHDDPCFENGKGREVKAADVKYSFELLCSPSSENRVFESTFKGKVKGADEFFEAKKNGKSGELQGVEIVDDRTVRVTLNSPSGSFLYILAGVAGYIVPREAIEKYGKKTTVGTGPFVVSAPATSEKLVLVRNTSYYRTDSLENPLPFLDTVLFTFQLNKRDELEKFKEGNLHLIFGLPSESISEMVEAQIADFNSKTPKYFLHRNSELTTQYYQFNVTRKPFNDVRVRQAFSYAINRDKIVADVLHSEAFGPGICGFVPSGLPGYDITQVKGFTFSPEKARKLLAEAGYPDGKDFPKITIEINSGGGKHVEVVEEVKKQLKSVLNIEMEFVVASFAQKLEDAKYGRADLFRSGWVADYPSPECFLRILHSAGVPESMDLPSYPNTIRYCNPVFDSLFDAGVAARTNDEANRAFMAADQLMIQDAPIIALWYGESLKMSHSYIKGFYFNSMNYKDFSETYIKRSAGNP